MTVGPPDSSSAPTSRRVVVVGGLNMDLVVRVARLPAPGEAVAGQDLLQAAGGKGANQAVAAARLGADVAMVGRVGQDAFGRELKKGLRNEGVSTRWVRSSEAVTGVALIVVDAQGENSIAVAPGANSRLVASDIPARVLARAEVVVTQLEVPLATVEHALRAARAAGVCTVLNASPASQVPKDVLDLAGVVIVNEHELAALTRGAVVAPGEEADRARGMRTRPGQVVVVTVGERGAVAVADDAVYTQPSWPVRVVDTTAAGDAFLGAFAAVYNGRETLELALRTACAAGALATTRPGAQPSLPTADEVRRLLG